MGVSEPKRGRTRLDNLTGRRASAKISPNDSHGRAAETKFRTTGKSGLSRQSSGPTVFPRPRKASRRPWRGAGAVSDSAAAVGTGRADPDGNRPPPGFRTTDHLQYIETDGA